ncbi:uncharacterized protein LAESUDRAFT_719502 [Laetiporus sulphureus 93-53]|uniref:Mediator of RNA polymerase II transcription subunit 13 n=1 Tax=Laetiporus sulphureus 93-53 TaxID=1314785 RepID=A0A165IJT8_9APHY|nr:uncharacterized protein LAESUDRAFT_719502 [Laetiporus sulphureus 93-53]KZT13177.1 hypothetical protein LAESUDRAFT_719502 [Laetiporus sulphureus 93-53]
MAARPHSMAQDTIGTSVLAQCPPTVSLASPILGSIISLPDNPLIAYSVFTSASSQPLRDPLNLIELARRKILSQNAKRHFLDSLLPSVHITKDVSALYVFAFGSTDRTSEAHAALNALQFDGLASTGPTNFTPSAIYPCSAKCADQLTPCTECLTHVPRNLSSASSSAILFPRKPLRLPLHYLLNAIRLRLIDDIATESMLKPRSRRATRLRDGFLLGPSPSASESEWGAGWEHRARGRPLIHAHLDVQLAQTRIVIHPILRPTFYLPLQCPLSVPSGTPITILPHGVPAYYLNTYTGPTSALTTQFEEALLGFGAGDWKGALDMKMQQNGVGASQVDRKVMYVIAWLAVQNKQGEDKGTPIIWPIRLCLAYHPNSPSIHARTPLPYEPELPAQLQASPPPPSVTIPPTLVASAANVATPSSMPESEQLVSPILRRPQMHTYTVSPASESLQAFRNLTLATRPYLRDVQRVAVGASAYVDSVSKERERERERLKRERESAGLRARGPGNNVSISTSVSIPPESTPTIPEVLPLARPVTPVPSVAERLEEPQQPPHEPAEETEEAAPPSSEDSSINSLFSPPADASPSPPIEDEEEEKTGDVQPNNPAEAQMDVDLTEPLVGPSPTEPPANVDRDIVPPLDTFADFDNSWQAGTNDFMDVDMSSYDMEGYNIGMNMGTRGGGAFDIDMDDGFGVFTDDDFNFFDAPAAQSHTPIVSRSSTFNDQGMKVEGLIPASGAMQLGFSPQRMGESVHLSGPGPPSVETTQPSPWPHHAAGEGLTPNLDELLPAPELLAPSPTKTSTTQSAPATPTVQILDQHGVHASHKVSPYALGPSDFDPIPFAPSHKLADSKYLFGKFALPSPPDSEDRLEQVYFPSSAPSVMSGWKYKYNLATDPRIGVVRKLIGIKRKGLEHGVREVHSSPSWAREYEEWESWAPSPTLENSRSDIDSDEDDGWMDDDDATAYSRPSTPPPSYLPLGPTLLQTQFHHARLLPLCAPLRPPGSAGSNIGSSAVPISVPTPVSPAAIMGASSERAKSLEAAAKMLVKEIVENAVWADAWRVNLSASGTSVRTATDVWQADVKGVMSLLDGTGAMQSPISLRALSHPGHSIPVDVSDRTAFCLLEPPMLNVEKSNAVIQVMPSALRFWEKLGLGPRAGKKDVTAYVFFEASGDEREDEVCRWLAKVSATYAARNYGIHMPGSTNNPSKPGLVPVRFEELKKSLANYVATLPRHPGTYLVFYIITPPSVMALRSTVLRNFFTAVKRANKAHPDTDVLYHFAPETLIADEYGDPRLLHRGLEAFVADVYDRILQPVERSMSRRLFAHSMRIRTSLHAPAFALARPTSASSARNTEHVPHVTFAFESRPSSLDVVDRHTMLHAAYTLTPCGRWLVAACVDERGEESAVEAWLVPEESVEAFVVNQVWSFARSFAARANVEWKLVVARMGVIGMNEVDAWIDHLENVVSTSADIPALHVTLLTVDYEQPWSFLAPSRGPLTKSKSPPGSVSARLSPRTQSGAVMIDTSSTTYALFPSTAADPTLCLSSHSASSAGVLNRGAADLSFVPDCEGDELLQRHVYARVPSMSSLIHVPARTDHTTISMVNVYQLHIACSPKSSFRRPSHASVESQKEDGETTTGEEEQTLRDVMHNFHALATLARARWGSRDCHGLPLHLVALEAMSMALSGEPVES